MLTTGRIHGPTIASALACALLACAPGLAGKELLGGERPPRLVRRQPVFRDHRRAALAVAVCLGARRRPAVLADVGRRAPPNSMAGRRAGAGL